MANRCPNCANRSFFPPLSLRVREECPICELPFSRSARSRLGAWAINLLVSVLVAVLPITVLASRGILPLDVAVALAVVLGGIGCPALFYRASWSWCLMLYYLVARDQLPGVDFDEWSGER